MLKGLMSRNDSLPYVGASLSAGSGIYGYFNNITGADVSVIVGILAALGTFLVNWYYKAKDNERAEELFKLKLKEYQEKEQDEQA